MFTENATASENDNGLAARIVNLKNRRLDDRSASIVYRPHATVTQPISSLLPLSLSPRTSLLSQFLLRFTMNVGSHYLRGVISTNFSGYSS